MGFYKLWSRMKKPGSRSAAEFRATWSETPAFVRVPLVLNVPVQVSASMCTSVISPLCMLNILLLTFVRSILLFQPLMYFYMDKLVSSSVLLILNTLLQKVINFYITVSNCIHRSQQQTSILAFSNCRHCLNAKWYAWFSVLPQLERLFSACV